MSHFWISSRKPYKAASTTTMCGWLHDVILDAGFQEGSARDVRSVGASVAVQSNLNIEKILEVANWRRLSTLQKHYFKPQRLQALSGILNVTSSLWPFVFCYLEQVFHLNCYFSFVLANKSLFFCEKPLLFPTGDQISFFLWEFNKPFRKGSEFVSFSREIFF